MTHYIYGNNWNKKTSHQLIREQKNVVDFEKKNIKTIILMFFNC
ncbi:hypothetical protein P791_2649 [Enterococcus faecalis NY9]|nr:hypothetical protein P791_2649 [Enterococcus faecalis NY9]